MLVRLADLGYCPNSFSQTSLGQHVVVKSTIAFELDPVHVELLNCRDSLHNRRHDDIHTLFHDPFLNVFMWSDLLTKAVDSNKVVEMYTGGSQQMQRVPTQ